MKRWPRSCAGALRVGGLAAVAGFGAFVVLSAVSAPSPGASKTQRNPGDVRRGPGAADTLVQRFYDSLATVEARIPPAALDLPALADRLGNDPRRMIEFVADSVRYEHYDGVLRGAAGTLISRSGNACDQSLLLRDLLVQAGAAASLRVAPASSATNERLVGRADSLAESAGSGPDTPADSALLHDVEGELRRIVAAMPALDSILGAPAAAPPPLDHHCWLQATIGGQSVEVDPLFGTPVDADPAAEVHPAVPDGLRTKLTLRVLLRGSEPGGGAEQVLQSVTFAVDSLGADPIQLSIVPGDPDFLENLVASNDTRPVLADLDTFFPVIAFRDRQEIGQGFTLAGAIVPPEPSLPAAAAEGAAALGGRLSDLLGGGGAAPAEPAAPSEPAPAPGPGFGGLVVEYVLDAPGGDSQAFRRVLASGDAVSSTSEPWERVVSLIQERQILVPTFGLSTAFVLHRLIGFYRDNRDVVEALSGDPAESPASLLAGIRRYPLQLLLLAWLQDHAAAGWLSGGGPRLHRSGPALLVLKDQLEILEGGVAKTVGIDIVRTGFEASVDDERGRMSRARMGVLSTLLELAILRDLGAEGVPSLMAQADSQGVGTVVLAGPKDPALPGLALDESAREALLEELEAGYTLIAFERPLQVRGAPDFGWWRIDPASGEILGVLGTREGGAQAATEYPMWKSVLISAAAGGLSGYAFCQMLNDDPRDYVGRVANYQERPPLNCWRAAACGAVLGGLLGGFAAWVPAAPTTWGPSVGLGPLLTGPVRGGWGPGSGEAAGAAWQSFVGAVGFFGAYCGFPDS